MFRFAGETGTVTETVRTAPGTGTEIETGRGTETVTETQSLLSPQLIVQQSCQAYLLSNRWQCTSRSTHSPTYRTHRGFMRSWRNGYSFQYGNTRKASVTSSHAIRLLCSLEKLVLARQLRWVWNTVNVFYIVDIKVLLKYLKVW